jgi:uncharacterized membrane protein YfcA
VAVPPFFLDPTLDPTRGVMHFRGMTKLLVSGVLIGAVAGLIAGLCGVGGGIVMVPAFVFGLGMSQRVAVATSLAVVAVAGLVGTVRNHESGLVEWRVVWPTALATAVVIWFAAGWLKHLSNETLMRVFAVVMIVAGVRMLFAR